MVGLKVFSGMVLNHSGRPETAGIGRGKTASNPGGHRNVKIIGLDCSMTRHPCEHSIVTLADAAELIRGAIAPPGEAEIVLVEQALGRRPQSEQTL
jgi:hypothetical protein